MKTSANLDALNEALILAYELADNGIGEAPRVDDTDLNATGRRCAGTGHPRRERRPEGPRRAVLPLQRQGRARRGRPEGATSAPAAGSKIAPGLTRRRRWKVTQDNPNQEPTMTNFPNVTEKELSLLRAIQYQDGNDPIENPIWTEDVVENRCWITALGAEVLA